MSYAGAIIDVEIWDLHDTRNLALIKKGLYEDSTKRVELKARLVNDFNPLSNVIEISQIDYIDKLKANKMRCYYANTINFTGDGGEAHWYVTNVDQSDIGAVYLTIERDVLYDFYNFYSQDRVIIKTESKPTSNSTKNNGQSIYYSFIDCYDQLKEYFPLLFVDNNTTSAEAWYNTDKKIALIDVISNSANENKINNRFMLDARIGQTSYILSYRDLATFIKSISNLSIGEEIDNKILGTNIVEMLPRIVLAPFELTGEELPKAENGKVVIPIAKNDQIELDASVGYLIRQRLCTTQPTLDIVGNGYSKLGDDITVEYDIKSVERLEVFLPYINNVDLTGFIDYFNGFFRIQFLVDSLTGNGFVGFTGNREASLIEGDNPNYILTIPFNCYREVDWIGVQNNRIEQAYGAITSLANIVAGGSVLGGVTGVASSLLRGNTTASHKTGNKSQDDFTIMLAGNSIQYGVRLTHRDEGITNIGFKNTITIFDDLPQAEVSLTPTTDYNIITVDITKRSWTGDEAIDNEIYNKLTQGGFVYNG